MYDREKYRLHICYHCGNKGLMIIQCKTMHDYGGPIFDCNGNVDDYEPREEYTWYTLTCPVCNKVTLLEKFEADYWEYSEENTLYPNSTIDNTEVPNTIKNAFEAALKSKNIDTAICALALRRTLEAICKEKGAAGKDLEQMISSMIESGILPAMYDDACWIIRKLGNSAAHADNKVFSKFQVDQTIEFVQNIINYLYVLPVKMQKLRSAIEAENKQN